MISRSAYLVEYYNKEFILVNERAKWVVTLLSLRVFASSQHSERVHLLCAAVGRHILHSLAYPMRGYRKSHLVVLIAEWVAMLYAAWHRQIFPT